MSPNPDELVMYLIIRDDLGMSPGKIAAQAGHAVQLAMRAAEKSDDARHMLVDCQLPEDRDAKLLLKLIDELYRAQVLFVRVVDEGRTQIPAGSVTAVAVQPLPKSQMRSFVGKLKLL